MRTVLVNAYRALAVILEKRNVCVMETVDSVVSRKVGNKSSFLK